MLRATILLPKPGGLSGVETGGPPRSVHWVSVGAANCTPEVAHVVLHQIRGAYMPRALYACIAAFSIFYTSQAVAMRRVALVIGNSDYPTVGALANPGNDANALGALFSGAKFDLVETKLDLPREAFLSALREFTTKSEDADIAVIYFAGHGMEMAGTNYLIPVDANLESENAIADETVSLERIMLAIEPAKRLRLVILDACRNNPFARRIRRNKSSRSAPTGGGLARVEIESSDTYVAFAARAGFTADDGFGEKNSPFAKALIKHLATPGLDIRIALGKVRDEVLAATKGDQEPYVYGSLGGDIIPLVPGAAAETAALPQTESVPAGPVAKPQTLDIGTTVSRHGDWTLNCQRLDTKDQCALVQSVRGTSESVGMTILFVRTDKAQLMMRVVAPSGLLLSSGLGLMIDANEIGKVGFIRCLETGCVAEVIVDGKLLDQLKQGARATFTIAKTLDENVTFPITLGGIGQGLDELYARLDLQTSRN